MQSISDIFSQNRKIKKTEISGEIISLEWIETRNGNLLLKMAVYDETSTMLVSSFLERKLELNQGDFVSVTGSVVFDDYNRGELTMKPQKNGIQKLKREKEKLILDDGCNEHRVSLQNYSFMTVKRGANPVSHFFEKAKELGHKSIAITDVTGVQAFPEMAILGRKTGIKPIYGLTALVVPDTVMAYNFKDMHLFDTDIVVFDVETTGFSSIHNDVIEIGASKISCGEVVDTFQRFVKINGNVPEHITELTGINDDMLASNGIPLKDALTEFDHFVGDAILAAHNAFFDMHMLEQSYVKARLQLKKRTILDTLKISRKVNEEAKFHSLSKLAKKYKVSLKNAHRADDDAKATAEILIHMMNQLKDEEITTTSMLENYKNHLNYSIEFPNEITIWVKNQKGLKNLYEIVSKSHTKYLSSLGDVNGSKRAVVPWELIEQHKEGLIVGSGGHKGRLFELALEKSDEVLEAEMKNYDVIQIEPSEVAIHLAINDRPKTDKVDYIDQAWTRIVKLAEQNGKYIIATDGAHYTKEEDSLVHNILIYSQLPPKRSHYARQGKMDYPFGKCHFRTTKEMFESFPFLDDSQKHKYIIQNTNRMAESIEKVEPIPVDEQGNPILYTPQIEGIDEKFRKVAFDNAKKIYGSLLPEYVEERLSKEINSIVKNGYAVIYMISRDLVKKSLSDGFLVGSRGSVGSSFAAMATEISEVNPLDPHYVCTHCTWNIFFHRLESVGSGFDLPEKFSELLNGVPEVEKNEVVNAFATKFNVDNKEAIVKSLEKHDGTCPNCKQHTLTRDGHKIPFETFLGFNGDKVPDIDLNFSGVYQSTAHEFTKEMFGENYVFRAGTVTTVAQKTAFSSVKNYYLNHGVNVSTEEIKRIAKKLEGARDSTGQHPGGVLVVPNTMEMTDFSPYQFPANDDQASFMTSHFDFNSIHDNILKLDILGHDAPTLLRYLEEYTGINPRSIPSADTSVLDLFTQSDKVLKVRPEEYNAKTGTLALPEMGTRVVQDVISETKPKSFADLISLSGLTHGTGVYYGNAQNLIQDGVATIDTVIGCRDDIMRYLIDKGVEPSLAFTITESVRKGKGLKEDWEKEMRDKKVPDWYIWSCNQIEYMFPRAHASAYVLDATRTGYFKVFHPLEFYASVFSSRYNEENIFDLLKDVEKTKDRIKEIDEEIKEKESIGEVNAAGKLKRTKTALTIALEAKYRGVKFGSVRLYESHEHRFLLDKVNNELIAPFSSVPSLGPIVARKMYQEKFNGVFRGLDDLKKRTKITTGAIEKLRDLGSLELVDEVQPTFY